MKGLGFKGEKPNSGPKTSKFDVLKVIRYVVLYKIKAKKSCLLSSGLIIFLIRELKRLKQEIMLL